MHRYFVEQFDANTFVVVDLAEDREICVCSNYEHFTDAQSRAERIADLLNVAQPNQRS